MDLTTLKNLNTEGIEADVARIILEKIAQRIPELTDYSPSSPHVVIAEAVAWASALSLYYSLRFPEVVEEYIVRELFGGQERPAIPAQVSVVMRFSTPAPSGGRTIPAGTRLTAGGVQWVLQADYVYPAGTYGNETSGGSYLYLVPLTCLTPGSRGNIPANTPWSGVTPTIPGLQEVFNPLPAIGGKDAETYEELRDRHLKAPVDNKLITPDDYRRFLTQYLGGGRVYVVTPKYPDWQTDDPNWAPGYVTIALILPDGRAFTGDPVLQGLLQIMSPMAIPRFIAPTITTVNVTAQLVSDRSRPSADLIADGRKALTDLINPLTWPYWGRYPNILYVSQIVAALQSIPGVRGVTVSSPSSNLALGGGTSGRPYAAPKLGTVSLTVV